MSKLNIDQKIVKITLVLKKKIFNSGLSKTI